MSMRLSIGIGLIPTQARPGPIAPPLALTGTPGVAMVGSAYSFLPTRTGGHGPFEFELDGVLPAGLTFDDETGEIAGLPTSAGTAEDLSIIVFDADGLTATKGPFDLVVTASSGLEELTLGGASILDKSATLASVGFLQGLASGSTVELLNDAGGRFLLTEDNEVRVGLVLTDRATNVSHNITVKESKDGEERESVITIPVAAPAATASPLGGSVFFQRRNGEQGVRYLHTNGTRLLNLFGTRAGSGVGGKVSGAFAFRFYMPRGALHLASQSITLGGFPTVMGTDTQTGARALHVKYCSLDRTNSQAYWGRFVITGRDFDGNHLGNYAAADTDGAPTGFASGNALRSAVITDDEPRLVVLAFDASTSTFTVLTIKLDGTVEVGDVTVNSAWQGISQTGASRGFAVGSYAASAEGAASINNYFSGAISDVMQIRGLRGTNSEWAEVAKGASPATVFGGSNVARHWPMSSASDLTQIGVDAGGALTAVNTGSRSMRTGPMLKPAYDGTDGVAAIPLSDGYLNGVEKGGNTAPLTCKVRVLGAACNVEARVRRQSDNAVIADWQQIGASVSGLATLETPAVPIGFNYAIDVRRADKTSLAVSNSERRMVGLKLGAWGQSQMVRWFTTSSGDSDQVAAVASPTMSFAVQRGAGFAYKPVDIGVLDNIGDLSDGAMAMCERLTTLAPGLPVQVELIAHGGTAIDHWTSNQDVEVSPAVAYPLWGDGSTQGSGLVTDLFREAGKDLTAFIHHHGTSDANAPTEYQDKMQALYLGTGPRAGVKSFAGESLPNPIHVLLMPLARHADAVNNPYSDGWKTFSSNIHALRFETAAWSPAGMSAELGGWLHDIAIYAASEGPHQSDADVRGSITEGMRFALATLRMAGLLDLDVNPALATITRTSGTVLTVAFDLLNGGSLSMRGGAAPTGFEVSEDNGATWSGQVAAPAFTAALVGDTVTLTKNSGSWAAAGSLRVRYCYGGPLSFGVTPTNRATQFANENTALNGLLFETYARAAPSNTGGYVQGLPIIPTETPLSVAA